MAEVNSTSGAGSSIVNSLKMGSGVDIQKLAEDLAAAETQPKIDRYTARKEKSEASISGYAALSGAVNEVKVVLDFLAKASSTRSLSLTNSSTAIDATINSQALATSGNADIQVARLALSTTMRSTEYASKTTQLNDGNSFNITVTKNSGDSAVIPVTTATPQGVVDAINASTSGIKATLVNDSPAEDGWYILLDGELGWRNGYSVSTSAASDPFQFATGTTAVNSEIVYNGLTIRRASNSIDDVIPGVTLNLKSTTATNALISISEDKSSLRGTIDIFVDTVNSFSSVAKDLTTEGGENEYSGSLSSDKSFVNLVSRQIKNLVDKTSSTPSGGLSSLRDLGLSFNLSGDMYVDDKIYNSVISTNYRSAVTMLTADTESQSKYDASNKGLSLDASIELDNLVGSSGSITRQSSSAQDKVDEYTEQLLELEQKLLNLQQKYIKQFAAMESLVQRSKDTQTYLEGQFESMSNMYK
jgi:flagellar hook-associated protein 2